MSAYNLSSHLMSYFYRYSTCFIVFLLRPVTTSFNWFFAVPVHGFCILKLSETGPVCGPSKKGNRSKTGPDFKALSKTNDLFMSYNAYKFCMENVHMHVLKMATTIYFANSNKSTPTDYDIA